MIYLVKFHPETTFKIHHNFNERFSDWNVYAYNLSNPVCFPNFKPVEDKISRKNEKYKVSIFLFHYYCVKYHKIDCRRFLKKINIITDYETKFFIKILPTYYLFKT
ncbi:hypothetical protein EDEG_01285 [Edhazardia aedis USNM 41457]|uniref:Uncharacterized protein n=1 Tax=Edhazardia aedis (strain USNM 41457) TaxID=1003232 RepID=J9DT61_EDHAE|nr:hypothetical protein EDEG_01285 [Edhazardia aedis USNM 41457]|eukprot:EJW04492.1 hypothetical protein EDEG_01285 [Edhazardia aedis USNM 41457]